MVGYGLRVALDAAIGLGEFGLAEAAGHFLLNLAHAQIALGAVIREGNARIPGEQQHGGFVLLQSLSQVMGVGHAAYNIGFGDAVALAVVPHQDGRPFVHPPRAGQEGPVMSRLALVGMLSARLVRSGPGLLRKTPQCF